MKKRLTALLMAALMLVPVLTGCGPAGEDTAAPASTPSETGGGIAGADTSKPVKLKMYLLGDKAADFDLVYEKVSERLSAEINATLEVNFLSWAEHDTKYSLLFSSGEDFDLIFTASGWAHYEQTAVKKGFYELTEDFLGKYAPDIVGLLPESAWEQAKIKGRVYMVPNFKNEYGNDIIGVRGDLMEKYGITEIKTPAELEAYFDKIVENEKDITPLGSQGFALQYPYLFQNRGWNVVRGTPLPLFIYEYSNPGNTEAVAAPETPEFREFAYKMKEMQQKGYWSKDALSTTDTRSDAFVLGKAAAMVWNLGSVTNYARQINREHPEWKATFVDIAPQYKKQVNPYTNNGVAVNANSKNAERAMMAINEFMTNKAIYDLTSVGIEGVHYTAVGEDRYTPVEGGAERFPADGSCNWGWGNKELARKLYVENPDEVLIKQEQTLAGWDASPAEYHPLSAFSFNEENVRSEVAVINTLVAQYFNPISAGLVDDVDKAVDEFISKLREAGIDRVQAELQDQIKAFLAENQ